MIEKSTLQQVRGWAARLILMLAGGASFVHADEDPSHYPEWSWDTVPVYLHFGSHTQLTDEQVATAARLSKFICLEKAHGRLTDRDHPERIMALDAQRLKQANPDAKVLMYWKDVVERAFKFVNVHRIVLDKLDVDPALGGFLPSDFQWFFEKVEARGRFPPAKALYYL